MTGIEQRSWRYCLPVESQGHGKPVSVHVLQDWIHRGVRHQLLSVETSVLAWQFAHAWRVCVSALDLMGIHHAAAVSLGPRGHLRLQVPTDAARLQHGLEGDWLRHWLSCRDVSRAVLRDQYARQLARRGLGCRGPADWDGLPCLFAGMLVGERAIESLLPNQHMKLRWLRELPAKLEALPLPPAYDKVMATGLPPTDLGILDLSPVAARGPVGLPVALQLASEDLSRVWSAITRLHAFRPDKEN